MYAYQSNQRYFAQVADDLADIAGDELLSLGATELRPIYRGIHFTASPEVLYRCNYQSRLINRILAPLLSFKCHSDKQLYRKALEITWEDFLDTTRTFAVFATVSHSNIRHSQFAALRLKDAIVDHFRSRTGKRPSVERQDPDVWFNLHVQNNQATISVDTSGGSLHRRGYRQQSVEAPIAETLAAAIIRSSGWDANTPLYDPFCGSGTFLCEAYMHACNLPAALLRQHFGFENLPDFEPATWALVREAAAHATRKVSKDLIAGSDLSDKAVKAARHNCAVLDSGQVITIANRDIFEIPALSGATLVCNPPYGIRLDHAADLPLFYKNFGDFLKQRCSGSTAFVYFGDRQYLKHIGLRPSWKKPLANGGLDGRLAKFELY